MPHSRSGRSVKKSCDPATGKRSPVAQSVANSLQNPTSNFYYYNYYYYSSFLILSLVSWITEVYCIFCLVFGLFVSILYSSDFETGD